MAGEAAAQRHQNCRGFPFCTGPARPLLHRWLNRFQPNVGSHASRRIHMLKWALIFFIIAMVAAFLGFGGIAGTAAGIAKVIFFAFLAIAAVVVVMSVVVGKRLL
jgi:uncharacterized membrane protein YtjA (UPF0391 family)